ncbi:MAG: hypothetical protein SFX18_20325 [Pirellulales bacterium]|nr:hypothetical protein [Pirellulales bacterium]
MPIHVVCQACKGRFQVHEKFAGKQGPCPKCKAVITIPKLDEQVVIHAPEEFSGGSTTTAKDAKGRSVLRPIPRAKLRLQPLLVGGIALGICLIFGLAWLLGNTVQNSDTTAWVFLSAGSLFLAPGCVYAGYTVLRDKELEGYSGMQLLVRVAIVSAAYAAIWAIYCGLKVFVFPEGVHDYGQWQPLVMAAPLMIMAVLTCLGTLDLEPVPATIHFGFFLLVSVVLRVVMGLHPW